MKGFVPDGEESGELQEVVAAQTGGDQVNKGLIATIAGVAVLAALVAGCGSSDDSTTSLTKAQFVASADAICKKGNAEIESEFEAFVKKNDLKENQEPSKAQQVELSETVLVPNVKNQSEEIRTLEAPSGDEDEISAMLDALDEGVEAIEADPQAPFNSKEPNPLGPANKLAVKYGLKVCGQG